MYIMSEEYVPLRRASEFYMVSKQTIGVWADNGTIDYMYLPSGQRRYKIEPNLRKLSDSNSITKGNEKVHIAYCRVSSHGQKEDLERQVEYMHTKYPECEIVTDIGSGLNWKRKGFRSILRRCMQGKVESVVVGHKDRLCRFGYEIFEFILGQCGVRLSCDASDDHKSREQELVDDILSIVTVFGSKIYGARKYCVQDHGCSKSEVGSESHAETNAETLDGNL